MLGLTLFTTSAVACESPPAPAAQPVAEAPACQGQPSAAFAVDGWPRLALEVAATPESRARGLMFRNTLAWDTGMLFRFDRESRAGFWMRNTPLPLSIAWLDRDGVVVDIQDMQPLSDAVHVPAAPYWYAIEANQGWFQANGVEIGTRVTLCLGDG